MYGETQDADGRVGSNGTGWNGKVMVTLKNTTDES